MMLGIKVVFELSFSPLCYTLGALYCHIISRCSPGSHECEMQVGRHSKFTYTVGLLDLGHFFVTASGPGQFPDALSSNFFGIPSISIFGWFCCYDYKRKIILDLTCGKAETTELWVNQQRRCSFNRIG